MKLPYIEAGEIVTTHGVRGEVKVLSWLDSPEMLCEFDRCRISGREYVMDSVRVQKTCNLVKLRGVDTIEDAQKLRGKTMELYREDISDELIFASELVDVEVYADGACIGKIKEVLDYPGNSVYVVQGEREYLIPAVKEFILSTDLERNQMQVKLLKGMASDEDRHSDAVSRHAGGCAFREYSGARAGAWVHFHRSPPDTGLHRKQAESGGRLSLRRRAGRHYAG